MLDAAWDLFRRQGYTATSVADLEAATGLRPSSLYRAFEDKAGLFAAALERYVTAFVSPRLDRHAGPGAALEDLEQLLLSLFELPLADGHGCLVTNTATELRAEGPGRGARVGMDLVARHVREVLVRELATTARADVETEVAALGLLYQGLLVLSRAGLLTDAHRDAVRATFTRLRTLRPSP